MEIYHLNLNDNLEENYGKNTRSKWSAKGFERAGTRKGQTLAGDCSGLAKVGSVVEREG